MKMVVAGGIIEQVKEFCYLGSMISDDATEKSRKGYIATAASIWFEIWGSWIRVKKSISTGKFTKNFNFSVNFTKEYQVLQANFRQLKKFDFPSKKLSIYSYLWPNYSISLQK